MDDLTNQLNSVLSNPESMAQIQNIMQSLGLNNDSPAPAQNSTPQISTNQSTAMAPDMINAITKIAPLLNQVKAEDDSTRLLLALKPLLAGSKSKKIDDALKVMQMIKLFPVLKDSGVLSNILGGLF